MTIATVKLGKVSHRIRRFGRAKKDGGDGVTWCCSCKPAYAFARGEVCWAMLALWRGGGHLPRKNVKLTQDGRRILHRN